MPMQCRSCEVLAALATVAIVTLSASQFAHIPDQARTTQVAEQTQETGPFQAGSARPPQTMLTDIVEWLSANTGLPAAYDHPRIELATPAKMHALRFRGRSGAGLASTVEAGHMAPWNLEQEVEALYDDASRTIYLHHGWAGSTPAEMSVLVHEMVHHLQNAGALKYECAQAREKLAYIAQDKWLAQFGRNLTEEFGLDAITLLLRTKCMH